jgi:putative solute:sodium symporter small subunit
MSLDKKFVVWALSFAAVGLSLGIYMAATQNHSELVAHAHIMLIGFVVSFIYGIIHKLWLSQPSAGLAKLQFVLHQVSAVVISVGLFLLYGNHMEGEKLEPILATASFGVLVGMLLMMYMVVTSVSRKSVA